MNKDLEAASAAQDAAAARLDRIREAGPELVEALRELLSIETSACTRSEAVGETGMRRRFTAARALLARIEGGE